MCNLRQDTLPGLEVPPLAALGNPDAKPSRKFDRISWSPSEHLIVDIVCHEFTCRCPVTKQPDWASIVISYTPCHWLVESKSLKLYLETWREVGIFHEQLAARIRDHFVEQIEPETCSVTVHFNVRGGIEISATADYYGPGEENYA